MDPLKRTLLFDFFGELLTGKQRDYYDLHYNEDLSLQEIAEQYGTSRQAVWDIIRRAEQTLLETEEKTGLVARYLRTRETLFEALSLMPEIPDCPGKEKLSGLLSELSDETLH